jgi:hypothetical protein
MSRRDAVQAGFAQRGRGRRRTAPLPLFDPPPAELIEAVKQIFTKGREGSGTRSPSGSGTSDVERSTHYFEYRQLTSSRSSQPSWQSAGTHPI